MDATQQSLLERWGVSGPGSWDSAIGAKARAGELISTWQQGRETISPNDFGRYATEGYAQNSLIYSCVVEKSTAFMSLPPIMTRQSGEIDENADVIRLLRNPNTYQDGAEFAEQIDTHLNVAGNVYVAKIRQSGSPERRNEFFAFPVQELQAVRPDKIVIRPGANRRDDVFLVKVDGKIRMEIPRRDMIHIKLPNPTNDFYGLSPIELLTREGTIDLTLSDFALSYLRNAGVPAGLLTVKGRPSKEQQDEIRSNFRRTFNGLRRWFEVLILNESVTDYKPIGSKLSEVGSEEERMHVESRICSVLGVPGQLVGARFALNASASAVYEQNQFQFWSESMVPESKRFAMSWTKNLHGADFATRQSVRNEVVYDYTGVRALQEDLSRKLREVVRMINTGGITVAAAFMIVGMDPPPNSDFYIRSANMAQISEDGTEILVVTSSGDQTPDPANPLEGTARMIPLAQANDIAQREFAKRRVTKTVKHDENGRVIGTVEEYD